MGFRYQLRNASGDDLGAAEYSYQPAAGDTIRLDGNRAMLVTAVVPIERMQEHVAAPLYGLLEIEPVAGHTPWADLEHKSTPEQLNAAREAQRLAE